MEPLSILTKESKGLRVGNIESVLFPEFDKGFFQTYYRSLGKSIADSDDAGAELT